ncbi:MAG TPA: hypothetical protein VNB94_09445 [Mycobacteriales bacterium]|nr:hypothetical protein [Mycobacteriales bacterium]
MRRMFWTALGIGFGASAGILVARRVRRTADSLKPAQLGGALSGAVAGLAESVRDFTTEIRLGMAEREDELITALGLGGTAAE